MNQESAILLVGILVFLVWASLMLRINYLLLLLKVIIHQLYKIKGDAQQVKTAQRASKKRELQTLKKIEDSKIEEVEFESIGGKKTQKFYNRKGEEIEPPF